MKLTLALLCTLGGATLFAQFQPGTLIHVGKGGVTNPYGGDVDLTLKETGVSCRFTRTGKFRAETDTLIRISGGGGFLSSAEESEGVITLSEKLAIDGREYTREIRYDDGFPTVTSSAARHPLSGETYLDLTVPYPRLRKEHSVRELAAMLSDPDANVRGDAIGALAEKGSSGVSAISGALHDKNDWVRDRAARALGAVADSGAVDVLVSALNDKSWPIRRSAAWALGRIRDRQAAGPLVAALNDQDDFVQHQAARALERITGQKLGYDTAKWRTWWSANKASFGRSRLGTAGLVSLGALALVILAGLFARRRFRAAHAGAEPRSA